MCTRVYKREAVRHNDIIIIFQDISNLITNSNRNYRACIFLTILMANRNITVQFVRLAPARLLTVETTIDMIIK